MSKGNTARDKPKQMPFIAAPSTAKLFTLADYAIHFPDFPASALLAAAASVSPDTVPTYGMGAKINVPGVGRVYVGLVNGGADFPYGQEGSATRGNPHQASPFEGGRPDQRASAVHAWVMAQS